MVKQPYGNNQNKQNNRQPQIPEVVKKPFKSYNFSDLIKVQSLKVAEAIYDEYKSSWKKINKNTQIRKFFDDLYAIKNKIDSAESNASKKTVFNENLPMIYLVASKAAYAKGRKHIGEAFYQFITTNVLAIEELDDFDKFIAYFEAVLGYYRYKNPSEN